MDIVHISRIPIGAKYADIFGVLHVKRKGDKTPQMVAIPFPFELP